MTNSGDPGDDERVERARAGDRTAFAELFDRHASAVRAFLFRLGMSGSELDDATQEVFVKLIADLSRFESRSSFRTWTFGIALNVSRTARASARRRAAEVLGVEPASELPPPEATSLEREAGHRLRVLLGRLPSAQREAFVLRHVEECSVEETARLLGLPQGTVKRQVYEARQQLMAWLAPNEVGP